MSNAIRYIDQRFAFKDSRISCLALIFNLKIPSMTVLYAKKLVQVVKYNKSYSHWYKPMALWLRWVTVSRETSSWVRFLMSAETLCSASSILCGTEPISIFIQNLNRSAVRKTAEILLSCLQFEITLLCLGSQARARAVLQSVRLKLQTN